MPAERRASYRVQLNPEHFTLGEAARLADYLAALRVSHLYSSPVLEAAAGSQHGYDVVNPYGVSRSLGGEQGWRRLQQALSHHSLALLLDIVPNHMAITAKNPWWWAVLENGQASRYASYFDVDWDPPEARNRRQIVLPVLGDHYGRVLEAGELGLNFDGKAFTISYYDKRFPVDPASLGPLLARAAG
ncbi:MAG: alpha-amylase family glycosyl hydrolase, partial [Candidatus Promineifilaceae bacterium]|nr:alpha-amylase family glycosyl hydrolase [Candidatus Promineifilaceae bacterium]